MQQNLLRWFFRAFVNRLGMHLIELYSGRLVIGADQYRKLTRKVGKGGPEVEPTSFDLTIAVAGSRDSGKSKLIEALDAARKGDLPALRGKLATLGGDEAGLDRLLGAKIVEVDHYTPSEAGKESARNRSTRRHAVAEGRRVGPFGPRRRRLDRVARGPTPPSFATGPGGSPTIRSSRSRRSWR